VLRRVVSAALGALVVVVGVCLVGRDYHYATDVVGAIGVVLALVPPSALVIDAFAGLGDDGERGAPAGTAETPTGRLPATG
jgi:undecaprenyl-diphosphatase